MRTIDEIRSELLELGIKKEPLAAKESSGESVVLVYPKFAVKVFKYDKDLSNEREILSNVKSDNLIKLYHYSDNYNVYEAIKPIKSCPKDVIKLLCNVAVGIYDLHRNGYVHGDTGLGNIGKNSKGNYVLFDMEDSEKSTSDKKRFRDVEMFLEDLEIRCANTDSEKMINALLRFLRKKCLKEKEVTVMFIGKERKRKKITYKYDIKDFGKLLNGLCQSKGI